MRIYGVKTSTKRAEMNEINRFKTASEYQFAIFFYLYKMMAYFLKKVRIVLRAYTSSLMWVAILLNGTFVFTIFKSRHLDSFSPTAMVVGRGIIIIPVLYLFYELRKKELLYYRNLGISRMQFLSLMAIIDFIISTVALILAYAI